MASPSTFVGAGRQVDLELGTGEYHRAHVPPVGDQPGGLREGPLAVHQRGPNGRPGGHPGGTLADDLLADPPGDVDGIQQHELAAISSGTELDPHRAGHGGMACGVALGQPAPHPSQGDQAIQRAAVQEMPARGQRDTPADRALAGP